MKSKSKKSDDNAVLETIGVAIGVRSTYALGRFPLPNSTNNWRSFIALSSVEAVKQCDVVGAALAVAQGPSHRSLTHPEHSRCEQLRDVFMHGSVSDALLVLETELRNTDEPLPSRLFAGLLAVLLHADLRFAVDVLDNVIKAVTNQFATLPLSTVGLAFALDELFYGMRPKGACVHGAGVGIRLRELYIDVGIPTVLAMLSMTPPRHGESDALSCLWCASSWQASAKKPTVSVTRAKQFNFVRCIVTRFRFSCCGTVWQAVTERC